MSLGFLAGCTELNRNSRGTDAVKGVDPLLGAPVPAPGPGTGPGPATTTLPPIAVPGSALSNAALAAGPTRPLDRDHDLRIGPGPAAAGPEPLAGGPTALPATGGGAQLRAPEPVAQPVSRTPASPLPAVPASLPRPIGSYEDAVAQLRSRGITWQRLEQLPQGEGWKFSCSVPSAQNPRLQHRYEARASDYLSAVKAVLDQIDKENAGRPGT